VQKFFLKKKIKKNESSLENWGTFVLFISESYSEQQSGLIPTGSECMAIMGMTFLGPQPPGWL